MPLFAYSTEDPHVPDEDVGSKAPAHPPPQQRCDRRREDLQQYLAQSGHGAHGALFSCYFVRDGTSATPLCIQCRRPIAWHPSLAQRPPTAALLGAPLGTGATPDEMRLPYALMSSDTGDVFEVGYSRLLLIMCGLSGLPLVTAVDVLAADDTIADALSWTLCSVCAVLFGFIAFHSRLRFITFSKSSLNPTASVTVVHARPFGCDSVKHTTVASLGRVAFEEAGNCGGACYVKVIDGDDVALTLHSTLVRQHAVIEYHAWVRYFRRYGIEPHPNKVPTALAPSTCCCDC